MIPLMPLFPSISLAVDGAIRVSNVGLSLGCVASPLRSTRTYHDHSYTRISQWSNNESMMLWYCPTGTSLTSPGRMKPFIP